MDNNYITVKLMALLADKTGLLCHFTTFWEHAS